MRYIVIFSDRTSKRVSAEQAEVFKAAMKSRGTVDFKGSTYAGYSIVAIKPIHAHEQEKREEARDAGLYRCKYGQTHLSKAECGCRDAGYRMLLDSQEEQLLLEMKDNAELGIPPLQERLESGNAKFLGIEQMTGGGFVRASDVRS